MKHKYSRATVDMIFHTRYVVQYVICTSWVNCTHKLSMLMWTHSNTLHDPVWSGEGVLHYIMLVVICAALVWWTVGQWDSVGCHRKNPLSQPLPHSLLWEVRASSTIYSLESGVWSGEGVQHYTLSVFEDATALVWCTVGCYRSNPLSQPLPHSLMWEE